MLTYDPASGSYDRTLVDGISENVPVTVTDVQNAATSGELKGLFDSKEMVNEYRADLETFAANLITEVNAQHEKGYDLYGYTNRRFFIGTGADDIVVNPAIKENVFRIAAASTQDGGPGDGSNALAISRLRETGFDDSYRNLISRLGVDTNESRRMKENQEALVGQLENGRRAFPAYL